MSTAYEVCDRFNRRASAGQRFDARSVGGYGRVSRIMESSSG
jgi:hypothetical protein